MSKLALSKPVDFRRVKYVDVDPEMILELLKVPLEGIQVGDQFLTVEEGIPEDGRVQNCYQSNNSMIRFVVESAEFPKMAIGEAMTKFCPVYTQTPIGGED